MHLLIALRGDASGFGKDNLVHLMRFSVRSRRESSPKKHRTRLTSSLQATGDDLGPSTSSKFFVGDEATTTGFRASTRKHFWRRASVRFSACAKTLFAWLKCLSGANVNLGRLALHTK